MIHDLAEIHRRQAERDMRRAEWVMAGFAIAAGLFFAADMRLVLISTALSRPIVFHAIFLASQEG